MGQSLAVDGDQLKRLMKTCRMICSGKGATVLQLRRRLGASRRTVFRDLNSLEEMGIDVAFSDDGYRIRQSAAQARKLLESCYTSALTRLLNDSLK